jgi:hypothetical protein
MDGACDLLGAWSPGVVPTPAPTSASGSFIRSPPRGHSQGSRRSNATGLEDALLVQLQHSTPGGKRCDYQRSAFSRTNPRSAGRKLENWRGAFFQSKKQKVLKGGPAVKPQNTALLLSRGGRIISPLTQSDSGLHNKHIASSLDAAFRLRSPEGEARGRRYAFVELVHGVGGGSARQSASPRVPRCRSDARAPASRPSDPPLPKRSPQMPRRRRLHCFRRSSPREAPPSVLLVHCQPHSHPRLPHLRLRRSWPSPSTLSRGHGRGRRRQEPPLVDRSRGWDRPRPYAWGATRRHATLPYERQRGWSATQGRG